MFSGCSRTTLRSRGGRGSESNVACTEMTSHRYILYIHMWVDAGLKGAALGGIRTHDTLQSM